MPKEAFFKLKNSKKEKIILAARYEFSNLSYDEVSINDIVKRSGISRGSFYLYFEDKWDIYAHLLKCTFASIRNRMKESIERGNNIFFTFLDVYDYIILENSTPESVGFLARILNEISPSSYMKIYKEIGVGHDKEYLNKYCFPQEHFTIQDEFEFDILNRHLIMVLTSHLTKVLVMREDPQKVRDELRVTYNMIKYGTYK